MPSLDARIRDLLDNSAEDRNRDNKGDMPWPHDIAKRLALIKDILAFANTQDGGRVVIGVENTTHARVGVSTANLSTWDVSAMHDSVAQFGTPRPSFGLDRHRVDGRWYVAVEIREFEDVPIICKEQGQARSGGDPRPKLILRRGAIYIRTIGAQSVEIDDENLMRSLLERARARKGEDLLRQVGELIPPEFRPGGTPPPTSPYDDDIRRALEDFGEQ